MCSGVPELGLEQTWPPSCQNSQVETVIRMNSNTHTIFQSSWGIKPIKWDRADGEGD